MTPSSQPWNELDESENPAVELLQSIGYIYVPPETLEAERDSLMETILTGRLARALSRSGPHDDLHLRLLPLGRRTPDRGWIPPRATSRRFRLTVPQIPDFFRPPRS